MDEGNSELSGKVINLKGIQTQVSLIPGSRGKGKEEPGMNCVHIAMGLVKTTWLHTSYIINIL